MSDDSKDKKNSGTSDGTGSTATETNPPTTLPFGELLGAIDQRIQTALEKRDKGADGSKADSGTPGAGDPQGIREQLRAELAKLQGEEAAAKKDADRDVTIEELKQQVAKLSEDPPQENVSKLTAFMWGKKTKKS